MDEEDSEEDGKEEPMETAAAKTVVTDDDGIFTVLKTTVNSGMVFDERTNSVFFYRSRSVLHLLQIKQLLLMGKR